jgi:hypothetical protein
VAYRAAGYEVVHIPKLSMPERADFLEQQLTYHNDSLVHIPANDGLRAS